MDDLIRRVFGACRLDRAVYEEVEHDEQATGQAALVVSASALAAGIGSIAHGGLGGLILITLVSVLGWVLWAAVIYLIGGRMMPGEHTETNVGELLRTLGFAQAPGLLRVFSFVPVLGPLLLFAVNVWMIFTMVMAVQQALDLSSPGRAVAVVLLGFLAYVLLFLLLGLMMGGANLLHLMS